MLLLTECVTSKYVLGFNYHILPAFSFDVGLQWDSMASSAYNGYKSIGYKIGYKMAIKLL